PQDDVSNDDVVIDDVVTNKESVQIPVDLCSFEPKPKESEKEKEFEKETCETYIEIKEEESSLLRVCEKNIVLYSKRHIQELVSEKTCFLTGALKPSVSTFSNEFLYEIKMLIEKKDSKFASNTRQRQARGNFNAKGQQMKRCLYFASSFIRGQLSNVKNLRRARLRDAKDFQFLFARF
ncbi:MAG: hypothetical protein Q8754_02770, partial [Sweet potato little leaf phytoplasma]|nr:hypothetical protein [Sweet potato little leaf phytoplasma]